ncbi:recombination regulator RecX [Macrococcoides caseolyticum]|uniref:recombination regulator RecX n=1 Tax=Macrococcoides caseolyticum TaxID=69966 RepID=UPI001F220515|nr:recombination regulator RecX [Macrococcus caseolyticus]MCE4957518.1 recombination regulator RecX [Macrococcus caseolyticus]
MEKKITKIEVQKNNKERFNLYINGEFFAGIDAATYVHFNLKKDLVVTDQLLIEIGEYDGYRVAINKAIHFLSYKKRTEKEVREYLIKCEVNHMAIDRAIQYCKENGYINHEDYCLSLMNTMLNTTDKGPAIFALKLKELGIEHHLIQHYTDKFETSMTHERIEAIAYKMIKKYEKKQSRRMIHQKIMQTLIQKGYNLDIANEALKSVKIDMNEDAFQKNLEKEVNRLSRKFEGVELKQKVIQSMMRKGFEYDIIIEHLKECGLSD